MAQVTHARRGYPFQLDFQFPAPLPGLVARFGTRALEWLLGFGSLNRIHRRVVARRAEGPFCERAIRALDVNLETAPEDVSLIPAKGPLVVVANHPFGGLDGLALTALLQRVRPDVKVLANQLLRIVPELGEIMLFVDAFGGPAGVRCNLATMRRALQWVRDGGALVVFPAGEVSSLEPRTGEVADPPWSPAVARLIRTTGATVLPAFFAGRNSLLFQMAGLIHPRLRTALLPRELLRQRGGQVRVAIGRPISPKKMAEFESDEELASFLRLRTHVLAGRIGRRSVPGRQSSAPRRSEPISPAAPPEALESAVANLPRENRLALAGPLEVWFGDASQAGPVLTEIGRLREITFRGVGEGSGKALDLDRFDADYLHLFVWNSADREVVGAYRLGLTDRLLERRGKGGLYTSTLFELNDRLLEQIGPAIELGRSFVRPEYQREFAPLMLLWKGIGLFVARHPRYRRLFGPVSISNEYQSLTREILIAFLRRNALSAELAKWVRPRNPPKLGGRREGMSKLAAVAVKTVEAVDELVGEIESELRGMPVLLRQYLKLNAKLLGFNVDPDFGNVLDGLMLVDLLEVSPAILARYMGRENLSAYYAHHGRTL